MLQKYLIRWFIFGYFFCAAIGWLLLLMPHCQKTSISSLDALLIASSALSTTGVSHIDIQAALSIFGQVVLLLLIQLGGIGYLIFNSFLVLLVNRATLVYSERSALLARPIQDLFRQAITYSLICEISGSAFLYVFFHAEGIENPLWHAIFHSISSFCTAGFSLFPSNLELFQTHLGINLVLSFLSLFGAFGFFTWRVFYKNTLFSLTTRLILIGGVLFFVTAHLSSEFSFFNKCLISSFHALSAVTTAGFNSISFSALPNLTALILILLMLYGGGNYWKLFYFE
jgi:trk system potassium uptake protein TrkH